MSVSTLGKVIAKNRLEEMVGREHELQRLLSWIIEGTSSVFLLFGKAGTGKTTLLQALDALLTEAGEHNDLVWLDLVHEEEYENVFACGGSGLLDNKQNRIVILDSLGSLGERGGDGFLNLTRVTGNPKYRFIVAQRQPPLGTFTGEIMELACFDECLTQEYWRKKGLYQELAHHAYCLTGGNPLLLGLLAAAVKRKGYSIFFKSIGEVLEASLIKEAVMESVDKEVLPLLEAAALVPVFTHEILEAITGIEISEEIFILMVQLPFISISSGGWTIHELVGHVLSESLIQESPQDYYKYKVRAYRFFRTQMERKSMGSDQALRYIVCLCESFIARQIFLAGLASESDTQGLITAEDSDLPQISQCWLECISCYSNVGLYETIDTPSEPLPEFKDIENLLALGPRFFRVLKDDMGRIRGYHSTLPVCHETLPYLASSPAMSQFFTQLSGKEIKRLNKLKEWETDTYVLRHLTLRNPADAAAMGAILRDILPLVLRKCCIITSAPTPAYFDLARGMGFKEVQGVFDTGFGTNSPVLILDFRELDLELWLEWLVLGSHAPLWLSTFVLLKREEWHNEVHEALSSISNHTLLGQNLLAPLAAWVLEGKNATTATIPAVRMGQYLYSWLEQEIRELEAEEVKIKRDSAQISALLRNTYFNPQITRTEVAEIMKMSEPTYYRWLHKARVQLAARMRQSVRKRRV